MIKAIGFIITIAVISFIISCKSINGTTETKLEKYAEQKNPEYYNNWIKIITDFESHLVAKGILQNTKNASYIRLLKKIKRENRTDFTYSYSFNDSIHKILTKEAKSDDYSKEEIQFIKSLDFKKSKSYILSEKLNEIADKEDKNAAKVAGICLSVLKKRDFNSDFTKFFMFDLIESKFKLTAALDSIEVVKLLPSD